MEKKHSTAIQIQKNEMIVLEINSVSTI